MTNPKSKIPNPKSLVLGIDTGGTYTDGVLLEYDSRQVLASFKSLTTHHDFSLGIDAVIDGIRIDDPAAVKMVSISTTLATNAIAEGKGKRVALLLIGYDPELVSTFKLAGRFATPHYFYFSGGHDLYGQEQAPLDLPAILAKVQQLKNEVDALAISAYFSPLNPAHETEAYRAISQMCDLPVVLGHQLSTKLGSVERATTAALNASLLAVLRDFIVAVRRSMERRGLDAPLMVVRGDGTLMSADYASRTPVETIHSGPAASAMGGRFLSGLDEALVIDIGGTTTDIALIEQGQVAVSETGAAVGRYQTAVQAANLLSIAIGGDSHIRPGPNKDILVGPERVTPLAYLAHQFPAVETQLQRLGKRSWAQASPEWLEYWFLLREPRQQRRPASAQEAALLDLLRQGPQPLPHLLKQLQVLHAAQLGVDDLLRREVIGRAGLTPTDLLHVEGRFERWNGAAAAVALDIFCRYQFRGAESVRQQVWRQMSEQIVQAVVTFLSEKHLPPPALPEDHDMGRWFFHNSLYAAHPHLETSIRLRQPIIGIGAPAAMLLPAVADRLYTELVLPAHHPVANAVGAVAGSVMVSEETLVYPRLSAEGLEVIGYYVQSGNGRLLFEELDEALSEARTRSRAHVLEAAQLAGADNPQVQVEEHNDGLDSYRIRARAVGNPRLGR